MRACYWLFPAICLAVFPGLSAGAEVPEGGAFVNRITLSLTGGPRTFYLSESGQLTDTPEPYSPG